MIAWATDLHLDHVARPGLEAFLARVRASGASLLLLGGDVSSGPHLSSHLLALLNATAPGSVRLILGNHDAYHDALAGVRSRVEGLAARRGGNGRLALLDGATPESLGGGTWLVGAGGWGDGRAGGATPMVALNDEVLIAELAQARARGRLAELLDTLGQQAAAALSSALERVPADARRVLVLTHVPPFPGATWHWGRPSEPAFLQRFCWAAGGETIAAFAAGPPGGRSRCALRPHPRRRLPAALPYPLGHHRPGRLRRPAADPLCGRRASGGDRSGGRRRKVGQNPGRPSKAFLVPRRHEHELDVGEAPRPRRQGGDPEPLVPVRPPRAAEQARGRMGQGVASDLLAGVL